ncbi:23S rRNA (uracil(1939)-C(5))-methyltransferase RlmD [Mycoplasmatota bacterium]|nr:23S rRNA (uracil(1939)-C(5))-methyltransferase RlmD [Mycoplasmatota bacterium]
MKHTFEVGQKLNINIKNIGINGEGIGYYERMAVFVPYALPVENVDVEVTEVFPNRIIAKVIETKKVSEHRIEPFCPIYHECGGCQLQHLASDEVAVVKKNILDEAFNRYTHRNLPKDIIKDTVRSKQEKGYRQKISIPMRYDGKTNHAGMYAANSRDFIEMDACPIHDPKLNEVVASILGLMSKYQIKGLDERSKKGNILTVIARITSLDEIQVTFYVLRKHDKLNNLAKDLMKEQPFVKSVFEVMEKRYQRVGFFNETLRVIAGKSTINESLNDFKFELKPEAFFQLNPPQAHQFYLKMLELAKLRRFETALDAYAGTAPISHYIASSCKKVYAIEVDKDSCESARMSLKKNNIDNVVVLQSTFKRALSGLRKKKIDVMFFDPPRTGLGKETIDLVLESLPKRIVYGSCNPSTLAKDLKLLMKKYVLETTIPFDMFPQTALVESVSLLTLKRD